MRISVDHFYAYRQLTSDPSWLHRIEHDKMIRVARRLTVSVYREFLEGWDGEAAIAALRRPVLIIQGTEDRLQPRREAEHLYAAANDPKRLLWIEGGHLPHLDHPSTLAAHLVGWLHEMG